ncbi:MAG: hypothetical protein LPK02_07485 [Rhodobacterales bacterium]|nr:hypothetical protein [Rhodobacterales bacterium]
MGEKIWPIGLYAPGGYTCKCTKCGQHHIADKRASHCADCTLQDLQARVAELEAELAGLHTANHRQALCIQFTGSALGEEYAATIDGLPKAARHVRERAEAAEALLSDARVRALRDIAEETEPRSTKEVTMSDPIKEAADWLAQDDATHWGEHEWRLFNVVEAAEELFARLEAAEAMLSEAVKAGMLEGAKAANEKETYWNTVANEKRQSGKDDNFACASANSAWRVADDIRAVASDPETIARIVAQLKEGRG